MTTSLDIGTAPKENAPVTEGNKGAQETKHPNCTTSTGTSKEIANEIARMALSGHVVIRGDRNDFTVCKYGLTRYCQDFQELQAFAQKLGVK